MMRKLIDIITEASIYEGEETDTNRIAEALNSLGIAYGELKTSDPVLAKLVPSSAQSYDVQFSKTRSRARDVLTEIARESGLDLQNMASTQAKDGSIWTHAKLSDGSTMVAAAAARDASRHRDHPDFGSYLHLAVTTIDEAAPTKYSKKFYTDTEQRDCVKVTNPSGDVIYNGPKSLFNGIEGKEVVDEEITGYKQLKGKGQEPVGNLPDHSPEEIEDQRKAAAKRVIAKRAAREAEKTKVEEGKRPALKTAYSILRNDASKASEILRKSRKEDVSFTRSGTIWNTVSLTDDERKLLNRRGINTSKTK